MKKERKSRKGGEKGRIEREAVFKADGQRKGCIAGNDGEDVGINLNDEGLHACGPF